MDKELTNLIVNSFILKPNYVNSTSKMREKSTRFLHGMEHHKLGLDLVEIEQVVEYSSPHVGFGSHFDLGLYPKTTKEAIIKTNKFHVFG